MLMPQPLVDKIIGKSVEFVPIVGPAYKFTRKAYKVTKLTNPVSATSRALGMGVMACTPPVIAYPALCALWAVSGGLGLWTANPIFIGASLEFADLILDE